MNKKISALILGGAMLAASVFAFAGCDNGHKHNYKISYQLADCDTEGYTLHTCIDCGYKYADDFVEPLGHAYGEYYHVDYVAQVAASYALTAEAPSHGHDLYASFTEEQINQFAGQNFCSIIACPICQTAKGQDELLKIYFYDLMVRMSKTTSTYTASNRCTVNLPCIEEQGGNFIPKKTVTEEDMQWIMNPMPVSVMSADGDVNMTLVDIIFPDSVTKIDDFTEFSGKNISRVRLSENLESIGKNVFKDSKIKSIVIPEGLQRIQELAFAGCEEMQVVYFKGTAEEWNAIQIGEGNEYIKNAARYYYSASKPTKVGNYWHYVDGEPAKW